MEGCVQWNLVYGSILRFVDRFPPLAGLEPWAAMTLRNITLQKCLLKDVNIQIV